MAEDRPALEIEITPQMIEAGKLLLYSYDPDFDNEGEIVRAIIGLVVHIKPSGSDHAIKVV